MSLCSYIFIYFLLLINTPNAEDNATNVKTLEIYVICPKDTSFPYSMNRFQLAASLANKHLESNNSLMKDYKFHFNYFDSEGKGPVTFRGFMNLMQDRCTNGKSIKLSAIFGPVCSYVLSKISEANSALWKLPLVTIGGFSSSYRQRYNASRGDIQPFKFITSVGYNYQDAFLLLKKMFETFGWGKAVFLVDYYYTAYEDRYCRLLSQQMLVSLNETFIAQRINKGGHVNSFKKFVNSSMKSYSILLFCMEPSRFHDILFEANKMGFNNGDYVFFNMDLFSSGDQLRQPWALYEGVNSSNMSIYKSVFTVAYEPLNSSQFNTFAEEMVRESNYSLARNLVNNFAAAFYDSIMMYARVLQDTLNLGQSIKSAENITENFKNISHDGISGEIYINENGDRHAPVSIMRLNTKMRQFETIGVYVPKTDYLEGIEEIYKGKVIPLDNPRCGYDNEFCPTNTTFIIIGSFVVFIIIVAIIGPIIFRRVKYSAELKAMNWLIYYDELESLQSRYRRVSKKENLGSFSPVAKFLNRRKKPKISRSGNNSREFLFETTRLTKSNSNGGANSVAINPSDRKQSFQQSSIDVNNKYSKDTNTENSNDNDHDSCQSKMSLDSIGGVNLQNGNSCMLYGCLAIHKGSIVALKLIKREKRVEVTRELLKEVKKIKDLNNDHVCRFIGACLDINDQYVIYEYCSKGSLKDILSQSQLVIDWMFRYSLIQDICRGMIYIHNNIGPHGNLKSSNCVVDSRFVLKITEFGLPTFLTKDKTLSYQHLDEEHFSSLLWTAPEILRAGSTQSPTTKSDVYSFAIVCQEIIYRHGHFYVDHNDFNVSQMDISVCNNTHFDRHHYDTDKDSDNNSVCKSYLSAKTKVELVKRISIQPFRPSLYPTEGCTEHLLTIVRDAWAEMPSNRPDFTTIKLSMRKFNKAGDSNNLLDNLLSRMEQYASNLEELVAQRTEQYLEEKRRAETLLYSMLPKSVAHQLIKRQNVIAESYEMVTVYFSDIVGFTALSADSQPMEIVTLLNKLYTTFDRIIELYDVYKIETIGDAYVVCSGLPHTNGNKHAREIARMAIAFVMELFSFVIPHRPETQLKLRIGVHSGPVCAGVVGVKMPRYCLFGDTVNTSSRMESSGLPLKIHISANTKEILMSFNTFIITERGLVEMKGKGMQLTYWLHGENEVIVDPVPHNAVILSNVQTDSLSSS